MNRPESTPATMAARPAQLTMTADGKLSCAGAWTLDHLADLERQIAGLPKTLTGHINCDVGAIAAMDTGGAWLLQRTLSQFESSKGAQYDAS